MGTGTGPGFFAKKRGYIDNKQWFSEADRIINGGDGDPPIELFKAADALLQRRAKRNGVLWFFLAFLFWGMIFIVSYWIFSPLPLAGEEILFDRLGRISAPAEWFDPDSWSNWGDISCRRGTHPDSCGGEIHCYPAWCFVGDGENVCCAEPF